MSYLINIHNLSFIRFPLQLHLFRHDFGKFRVLTVPSPRAWKVFWKLFENLFGMAVGPSLYTSWMLVSGLPGQIVVLLSTVLVEFSVLCSKSR